MFQVNLECRIVIYARRRRVPLIFYGIYIIVRLNVGTIYIAQNVRK